MEKTVLITLDLQTNILSRLASGPDFLTNIAHTLAAARAAHIPIIHITVSFRPGYPELSPHNPSAARLRASGDIYTDGSAGVQMPAAIAPQAGDVCVTKRRVGAFAGSDLDAVLRGLGAARVVVFGVGTSGAVLSTVLAAVDLDYAVVVLGDLCRDGDDEVHRVLVEKVFPKRGVVVDSGEWVRGLGVEGV